MNSQLFAPKLGIARHAANRAWLWLTRPLACKLGRHTYSLHNWGYDQIAGEFEWFCSRCKRKES